MKKMTCALLLCLLSASAMFSCQSGASGTQAGTEADTGTSDPVPVETEEAYAYPEVSLGGDTFHILYMTQPYYFYDSSDFDGLSGETVDDAVYQRNRSVEDRFDMTLEFDKRFELEDAVTNLSNLIMAGDTTHDAALLVHRYLSSLITQNYLYDLNTLADHFTFDEPWWNKELNDEIQIGKQNARLAAFTDTALTTFEGTMVTYINEAIRENLDLDEPYDLVRNGKWTMDAMRSYMKAAANLNGAADFTYAADTPALYGMTSFNSGHIAFLFSGDTVLFEQDKNGEITYMPQADRLITKAQKIIEDLSVPGEYFYYNNSQDENFETVFQRNQALLMVGELKAASLLRSMNADFGILPIPKFDEAQEAYRNSISFGYVACIPTTAEDPGVSADILDVLAYETYRDVMPLFVNERISQKALRSDVSVEMLSLIQQSRCFDIGYIFGWSTDFYNVFNNACQKGDTDIVSALEKTKEKTASLITKTMDAVNTEA